MPGVDNDATSPLVSDPEPSTDPTAGAGTDAAAAQKASPSHSCVSTEPCAVADTAVVAAQQASATHSGIGTDSNTIAGTDAVAAQHPSMSGVGKNLFPDTGTDTAVVQQTIDAGAGTDSAASHQSSDRSSAHTSGTDHSASEQTPQQDWFPLDFVPVLIQNHEKFNTREVEMWMVAGPTLRWAALGFTCHWLPTLCVPFFSNRVFVYVICGVSTVLCMGCEFMVSIYACFVYSQEKRTTKPLNILFRFQREFKVWAIYWAIRALFAHSEVFSASNFVRKELTLADKWRDSDTIHHVRKFLAGVVYCVLIAQCLRCISKVVPARAMICATTISGMGGDMRNPANSFFAADGELSAQQYDSLGSVCWWLFRRQFMRGFCGDFRMRVPGPQSQSPMLAVGDMDMPMDRDDLMSKEIALNTVALDARMSCPANYQFFYNERRMRISLQAKNPEKIEHRLRQFSERYARNFILHTNLTSALILLTESVAFMNDYKSNGTGNFYIYVSLFFAFVATVIRLVSVVQLYRRLAEWIEVVKALRIEVSASHRSHESTERATPLTRNASTERPFFRNNMDLAEMNTNRILKAAVFYFFQVGTAFCLIGYAVITGPTHSPVE